MKECQHYYIEKTEPQYIPNYPQPGTTGSTFPEYVATSSYRCICCGTRFGYVPNGSKVVDMKTILDAHT